MKIKPLEIVKAVATIVFFLSLLYLFLFTERFAPLRELVLPTPTVVYESLPRFDENEEPYYQPITPSPYTEINTFRDIVAWNNYPDENSLLLSGNTLLIAGYIEDENKSYEGRTSVDLVTGDINTGQVYWQARVGGNILATDGKYVFAETITDGFDPVGITAYDLASGEITWQTTFEWWYALGVEFMVVRSPVLLVNTFNKGNSASYKLDLETGDLIETNHDRLHSKELVLDGLVFSKEDYDRVGPIVTIQDNDGSFVWRYNQSVVSNIAIGGPVTYFVTQDAELVAVDTMTGDVLGSLSFTPAFPEDFDFWNNHIIVAANGDTVAVYFRDKRQLSLFHFENGL